MLFVLVCAGLLLIVVAAVGLPLVSGARAVPSRGQYDRAVYRDQLQEVERDAARGVLTADEAGAARLEIQRRLLAVPVIGGGEAGGSVPLNGAADGGTAWRAAPVASVASGRATAANERISGRVSHSVVAEAGTAGSEALKSGEASRDEVAENGTAAGEATSSVEGRQLPSTGLAAAMALLVLLVAGGLYWHLGAPALSDAPFASRPAIPAEAAAPADDAAAARTRIRQAAERLEQKLLADPSNAGGWILFARTESMLGEWGKAADAYKRAIDLGQKNGDVFAGYGEMQVMVADGQVSPAAHDAFVSALAADTSNGVARYYLALADAQAGDARKAIDAWLQLAAGLPQDSPMREEIARRITEAAKTAGIDAPPMPKGTAVEASPPGPTPEQMAAAATMPPDERAKMINGMIDQLAAKLSANPNDLDGWLRLGRAYLVRGDSAKAVDAYDHAAALKPGDPGIGLQTVAALLSGLKPSDSIPPRALALLRDVAAVAPEAPEVLWYLGVVAARDGRAAEARDKWTRLLTSLPAGGEDAKMVRAALGELKGK